MKPTLAVAHDLGLPLVGEVDQLDLEEFKAGEVVPLGRVDVLLELRVALLK